MVLLCKRLSKRLHKGLVTEMNRATIKDVARIAGVDVATVSRSLSNKPYVAEDTKARIAAAVETLGYRPSAAARAMVSKRTRTIAMLVPHFTDMAFDWIITGAEREARKAGYTLLVAGIEAVEAGFFSEDRVDGVLVIDPRRFQQQLELMAGIPRVSLEDVPMDNRGGARALAQHLHDLGHRQVLFLGGPADSPYSLERLLGIREVFPSAAWQASHWTIECGYELLKDGLPIGMTAVLAANDFIALGALRALSEHGLRVPEDVSLTGFDDEPIARFLTPALTTVRQDLEGQGARATRLLLDRLEGSPELAVGLPQPVEIIIRESTAAVYIGGKL